MSLTQLESTDEDSSAETERIKRRPSQKKKKKIAVVEEAVRVFFLNQPTKARSLLTNAGFHRAPEQQSIKHNIRFVLCRAY